MSFRWSATIFFPVALSAQMGRQGDPPLTVSGKLRYHAKRMVQPTQLARIGLSAGFQQALGTPKEWGQGGEGFGRRYASSFGSNVVRQSFTFALDTTLHEDPRYFLSGKSAVGDRVKEAFKQVLVCHTDSGGQRFAFARIGAAYGTELLSNQWRPRSNSTVGDALVRASSTIVVSAASNLLHEFRAEIKRVIKH